MKGRRPFTRDELKLIPRAFSGQRFELRNHALFVTGIFTGFRAQELVALRKRHIMQGGHFLERIYVERQHMKRKREGRSVIMNPPVKAALADWLAELHRSGFIDPDTYLFQSQKPAHENTPITTQHAYDILTTGVHALGITGPIGTHSLRKTFAKMIYDAAVEQRAAGVHIEPLFVVQSALGHKSIETTRAYLSFDTATTDNIIMGLAA
ncbi:MAG: tyrosine-type recombinase/integrase [Desulfovibrio sp.]